MINLRPLMTALFGLLLAAPAGAQNQAPALGRPCRDDLFFVDIPLPAKRPWSTTNHVEWVRSELEGRARTWRANWFCGPEDPVCAHAEGVSVQLEAVLPQRAGGVRADGHLRFFRFSFVDAAGGRLAVDRGAQCDVVENIRSLFDLRFEPDIGNTLNIGRECDAQGLSPEGDPSDVMRYWHLGQMSLGPADLHLGEPNPGAPPVNVALVDSGVDRNLAIALGMSVDDPAPVNLPPIPHRHAGGMALLIRQMAPDAKLFLYPALDPVGNSPIGDMARALDRALYDPAINRADPTIVNLSLGWPPELGRPGDLFGDVTDGVRGNACTTLEDPVGESVRFLLEVARTQDTTAGRISVFAAAGNRQRLDSPPELDAFAHDYDLLKDPCGGNPALRDDAFYPAEWSRRMTCRRSGTGRTAPRALVTAVGALDHRDEVATLSSRGGEAPLMAAGEHVYVEAAPEWAATVPITPIDPVCVGDEPPSGFGTAQLTLPMAISGTSASTALTSGMAARAYWMHPAVNLERVAAGKAPLRALERRRLARLLYATGEATCTFTETGLAHRRIDFGGLDRALRCAKAPALLNCLGVAEGGRPLIESDTVTRCAAQLTACGFAPAACAPQIVANDWAAEPLLCDEFDGFEGASAEECLVEPCFWEMGWPPEQLSMGSLGPQPPDPTCPDCRLDVGFALDATARGTFVATINKVFPVGTTFTNPVLTFKAPDNKTFSLSLADKGGTWTPGASFKIYSLRLPPPTPTAPYNASTWRQMTVNLVVSKTIAGKTALDTSPIRVVVP